MISRLPSVAVYIYIYIIYTCRIQTNGKRIMMAATIYYKALLSISLDVYLGHLSFLSYFWDDNLRALTREKERERERGRESVRGERSS